MLPSNSGHCNICEQSTTFVEHDPWLRDHYRCARCGSIPRNRALVNGLNLFCPEWQDAALHESSPGGPFSSYLRRVCSSYTSSHCYADVPRGDYQGVHRSEDLTALTFADASFEVFVTSDVFEHVLEPERAFAEIARVLRKGGAHVFTLPWYRHLATTAPRAQRGVEDQIVHLMEPVYHGNPLSVAGALVTRDWGRDIGDVVYTQSGMHTTIYLERDRAKGLDGDFLEVFISRTS